MIWALLLLVLVAGLVIYQAWREGQPPARPLDPEAEAKAAVELHAIRGRLEAAELRAAQRRDAARLRRDIREALDDDEVGA